MAYRRFHRTARPQARIITAKYAGQCACCGAAIAAGETVTYYPPGTIANVSVGKIAHVGGLDGNSVRCTVELRKQFAERAAVNDYAGDGLDARWEDQCADVCGR